ncbi:MAG: hypothetical protein ACI9BF_000105 [Candidatus Paceibacteria bacterium]|jgi:hypothetical protein
MMITSLTVFTKKLALMDCLAKRTCLTEVTALQNLRFNIYSERLFLLT